MGIDTKIPRFALYFPLQFVKNDVSCRQIPVFVQSKAHILASAQSLSCSKMGSSARQLSVGPYSTRTGTSRYSRRVTSPSCYSSRRAEASTVLEMPSSLLRRAL